ncbi:hypothetical protein LBMAG42_56210 [Deltaproteobacteria bacterium]|nr:hypothetical protein LBMAG42_56210 [Deltaproteobacteria bacterium]
MIGALLALLVGCAPRPVPPPPPPGAGTVVELSTGAVSTADRDTILRIVGTAAVRPCFEALLAGRPTAYGEVVVRFTIGSAGAVEAAAADFATLGDVDAEACVAAAVRAVNFPNRDTPITVLYPFLLVTERTPPEIVRALKARYGLLSEAETTVSGDPRTPPPPGVLVLW